MAGFFIDSYYFRHFSTNIFFFFNPEKQILFPKKFPNKETNSEIYEIFANK